MSVAPAGVALTGNTGGPDSDYRLALNRNNQWRSQLQILNLSRFAAEFRRAYGVRPSAARPDSMPA